MRTQRISAGLEKINAKISIRRRRVSGDMLVLLHGLGGSQDVFKAVWRHPAFAAYSILTMDFLGFGASDKPGGFSYAMEDQAGVLNNLIRAHMDAPIHIVAHSMGGAVALLLADDVLKNIASFSNLEGNLIGEDCFLSRKAIDRPYDDFDRHFFPKLKRNMQGRGLMSTDLDRASPLAYYKSCQSLVHWSDSGILMRRFKALNCSKAYFYGDRNADIEPLRHLKALPCMAIPKSGHMMMLDNSEEFYARLKSFLP